MAARSIDRSERSNKMDLIKQPPRRPTNLSIAGIVGLARMTDKARAYNNETIGQYLYGEDSALDRRILSFLGLTAETFAQATDDGPYTGNSWGIKDDTELGQWVAERSNKSLDEITAFNQSELDRVPTDDWQVQLLKERIDKYAPDRTDIKTVLQSMELDDWGSFWEVDLQVCPPRSPYNRDVAGLFGLARMADKARASRCRKNGDYKYGESSASDQYLLELIGTEADQFQQAAVANPNDVELAEWVLSHTNINKLAWPLYNQQAKSFGLQAHLESDPGKPYFAHFYRENFDKRREIVSSGDTTVQNWLDLMDYDDQKSFGIIDLARRPPEVLTIGILVV
ncbi:TPA: DUF5069 domain-containing protein [Candidatus Poribacteria bacterium]|nr:DUF5069 domain-containing protein [Candidatus Poribacteria bacterium]